MSSKLRAGGVFPYVLSEDRTERTDPQFMLLVLSGEDADRLADIRAEYVSTQARDKRTELLNEALKLTVKSCLIPGYESASLRSFLTDLECWELINGASEGAALTLEQRKKFVSQPLSEMA